MPKNPFDILALDGDASQNEVDALFDEIQRKWLVVQHRHDHPRYGEYKEQYEALRELKGPEKREKHRLDLLESLKEQFGSIIEVATSDGHLTESGEKALYKRAEELGLKHADARILLGAYTEEHDVERLPNGAVPIIADNDKPKPKGWRKWLTRARIVTVLTLLTITTAILLSCFVCSVLGNFVDLY
ncbi:MAG: hypothetical protein GY771_01490 [bacterium]|nr:hypothetical protein [bacterium]